MNVQASKFLSFPQAFSENPDETPTGPPINTFGGNGPRISSFKLSILRLYLLLFLWLFVPGQTFSADLRNLYIVSYPARPAKLPLWLAQDTRLFERNGLKV